MDRLRAALLDASLNLQRDIEYMPGRTLTVQEVYVALLDHMVWCSECSPIKEAHYCKRGRKLLAQSQSQEWQGWVE